MRVVINQLASLGVKTGIGHYTVELLRCLREQAGDDEIESFPNGWIRRAREACTRLRPRLEGCGRHPLGISRQASAGVRHQAVGCLRQIGRVVMAQHFRMVCAARDYDLYHEPNFIALPCDRPTIATIHDLSVMLHPEWHPADRVAYFERHFHRAVKRCQHFFAISEFGRQEVIRHLGIAPERVTRTYMGIRAGLGPMDPGRTASTLQKLGLPPQYLLYLGTLEPRKNVLMLLQAYCALPASVRGQWPLLLVGGWGWNAGELAEYLHNQARHQGVIHFGYLAEEYLPAIYNGARALLYPTLYEGFGLPPIEMMACGGAVIASSAGAVKETVGSKAYLIAAEDKAGWHDAMLRVSQKTEWVQTLRQGAADVVARFTWQECASDTIETYRLVARGGRHLQSQRRAA